MKLEKEFKIWTDKKFCMDGKQVVPLSFAEVGFMKDAFHAGYNTRLDDAVDFVIQYLYSEHQICDPDDCAAPYTPAELKDMAIKILNSR